MVKHTGDNNNGTTSPPTAFFRLSPVDRQYVGQPFDGFFASALTHQAGVPDDDYLFVRNNVGSQVERAFESLKMRCYFPVKVTEPGNPVSQGDVDSLIHWLIIDVVKCLVAYEDLPANGVGAEVEMARNVKKPIIRLCKVGNEDRERLPKFLTPKIPNPKYLEVTFDNPDEIGDKLAISLYYVCSYLNLEAASREDVGVRDRQGDLEHVLDNLTAERELAISYREVSTRPISAPISVQQWINWELGKPDLFDCES